ncbi:MAG: septum formation initiator family protein [Buchnera aphidicola (Schlechtendalia peitan)]
MIISKIGLVTLLLWLHTNFFLGKHGLCDYIKLYKQNLQKKENIFYLSKRNLKLSSEIRYWNFNDELKEEYARSTLGMIKKGETFYRIITNDHVSSGI